MFVNQKQKKVLSAIFDRAFRQKSQNIVLEPSSYITHGNSTFQESWNFLIVTTDSFGTFKLGTRSFSLADVKPAWKEDLFVVCLAGWKNSEIPLCLPDAGQALILTEDMSLLAVMLGSVLVERWEMTGTKWLGWNTMPGRLSKPSLDHKIWTALLSFSVELFGGFPLRTARVSAFVGRAYIWSCERSNLEINVS